MSDVAQKKFVTASDVNAALRKRWGGGQESMIAFEVAQGTGSAARRHLDAVAMELWPSRGLALHGIEVKVNLYDFRREAKDPQKAEEIARFCDYFWIAAPADIIPLIELPSAWGLLELGQDGKLCIKKQALKTDAQPVTRMFMAAMMRAATRPVRSDEIDALFTAREAELQRTFKEKLATAVRSELGDRDNAAENWRKLESLLKDDPEKYIYSNEVIAAVKFVVQTNFIRNYGGMRTLIDDAIDVAVKLNSHADILGIPKRTDIDDLQRLIDDRKRR